MQQMPGRDAYLDGLLEPVFFAVSRWLILQEGNVDFRYFYLLQTGLVEVP